MNILASLAVVTASLATGAASVPPAPMEQPAYREPARPWTSVEQAERARECRDRIEQVLGAAGEPERNRSPADPDKPLLMYAVDTRIDDCGVIIPVADPSDIRQGPPPGRPQLIPAR